MPSESPASNFRRAGPRNRVAPRAYGTGKYGVGKYSESDATRYLWTRTKASLLAFMLVLGISGMAQAQNTVCESADARTTALDLCLPANDVEGSIFWGSKNNNNFTRIDAFFSATISSFAAQTSVAAATAALQGQINSISSTTAAHTNSLNSLATTTTTFQAILTNVGASTASLQSQITSGGTTFVRLAGDSMTGSLTMVNPSSITIRGPSFSVGASTFVVAGGSVTVGGPARIVGVLTTANTVTVGGQITQGNSYWRTDQVKLDESAGGGTASVITNADGNLQLGNTTITTGQSRLTVNGASISLDADAGPGSTPLALISSQLNVTGLVGISSATPTEALGVQGNVNISGVYKQGTTAGDSDTCTAGQYLEASVTKGGIVTGGNCSTPAGAGDVLKAATQTFSGENTFSGDLIITGRLYGVPVSSQTISVVDWSGTNTIFQDCVSTLTVTTNGSPIKLVFNGHLTNGGSAQSAFANIYQDGNFISPFSQTLAMAFYKDGNGGNVGGDDISIDLVITPSAGSHSYCIAFHGGGNTWTVENDQRPSVFRIDGTK